MVGVVVIFFPRLCGSNLGKIANNDTAQAQLGLLPGFRRLRMAAEKDTGTSQLLREAEDAASFITSHIQNFTTPKVAIVCGSGLSTLADSLIDPVSIPYSEIPHFVVSSVAGHSSRLVYGLLGPERIPTLAMVGRFQ